MEQVINFGSDGCGHYHAKINGKYVEFNLNRGSSNYGGINMGEPLNADELKTLMMLMRKAGYK